jgi:hypothetical protein
MHVASVLTSRLNQLVFCAQSLSPPPQPCAICLTNSPVIACSLPRLVGFRRSVLRFVKHFVVTMRTKLSRVASTSYRSGGRTRWAELGAPRASSTGIYVSVTTSCFSFVTVGALRPISSRHNSLRVPKRSTRSRWTATSIPTIPCGSCCSCSRRLTQGFQGASKSAGISRVFRHSHCSSRHRRPPHLLLAGKGGRGVFQSAWTT